jgi:prophage maintenance system killer protein
LFYYFVKDHPFVDGNKRIGAFMFILFLYKNNYLYDKEGEIKINSNTLVSLALLIAKSDPKEKELIIKLIMNLISEDIQ